MSDDIAREKALEKIKKLLRMAKDGRGNPNEAETAMRQAVSLMAKFNIDESEAILTDLRNDVDAVITMWRKAGVNATATSLSRAFPAWCGVVSYGVGKLYDCRTFIKTIHEDGVLHGKCVVFGGYKTDVQVAAWTFDYLVDCVKRMSRNFDTAIKRKNLEGLKEFGIDSPDVLLLLLRQSPKARKQEFRETMAAALQGRLVKLKRERDAAAQQASPSAGTALAVFDAKQAALKKHFGEEGEGKTHKGRSGYAAYAGAQAGQRARLEPNPLQHSRPDAPLALG